MNPWVDVSKKLPEEKRWMLLCGKYKIIIPGMFLDGEFVDPANYYRTIEGVTHYTYFPDPPKD